MHVVYTCTGGSQNNSVKVKDIQEIRCLPGRTWTYSIFLSVLHILQLWEESSKLTRTSSYSDKFIKSKERLGTTSVSDISCSPVFKRDMKEN